MRALEVATAALSGNAPIPVPVATAPEPARANQNKSKPTEPPTTFDREALLRHAEGSLSSVFGPSYADLDGYEPRVRLPKPPLLLVSRVLELQGTRGEYGPSRILTEYDLPLDAEWAVDGRPPPCVLVESGQADMFLASYLGVDADCRGERVYRLLDCDLCFHAPRPVPGTTLRHDIRIDSFARLGDTVLFYFQYDCTVNGELLLTMRNGVAGFFTPEELAIPKGVDLQPRPGKPRSPVQPTLPSTVRALDDQAITAVSAGRFSEAFGPSWALADGSTLTLPRSQWCLVHRGHFALDGDAHGLGYAEYTQDLRDDDWFNPVHFQGDPCMPGTLMYDGCLQAVQLWLLAHGHSATFRDATFEPMPGVAAELRCRGQVVPGHSELRYRATIRDAGLQPTPWAIADVVLIVDGTPVVRAENVGVRIEGEARKLPWVADDQAILEYSVGSAIAAFGPSYAPFDTQTTRCARMPGPPYLTMTRVVAVEGEAGKVQAPASVTIAYQVPERAWYLDAGDGTMPFAVLLETALQPCGWITAWQEAGIEVGSNLYFRNLGGTAVQLEEIIGGCTLVTKATQTSVSASGGLSVQFFSIEVFLEDRVVFTCTTHFGYFTAAALDGQKGLPLLPHEKTWPDALAKNPVNHGLAEHPELPRSDWRMLDTVTAADPNGGRAGLGLYEASKNVDINEWFFTAHFYLDPVMPGSLGLEALLQLARWVWAERTGGDPGDLRVPITIPLEHEVSWKYRGQVRTHVQVMTAELEVVSLDDDHITCVGLIKGDGLAIYRFEQFGLATTDRAMPEPPWLPEPPVRTPVGALLDTFEANPQGTKGTGTLWLDPARLPWLADHCPTVTVPAVPMAFAAEMAVEAASLLTGLPVCGVPDILARKWIHTGSGPTELVASAERRGDEVVVSLQVDDHEHMRVTVALGDPVALPPLELPTLPASPLDPEALYEGGHMFHGPSLAAMTEFSGLSETAATAVLEAFPDEEVYGPGPAPILDPALLDAATHPMLSGMPERWVGGESGKLAYPVRLDSLVVHGPRPTGEVQCLVTLHPSSDEKQLVFDVVLQTQEARWVSYRWVERIVRAGPVLGVDAALRRSFIWEQIGDPRVVVGTGSADGWTVRRGDLIEPLEHSIRDVYASPEELEHWPTSDPGRLHEVHWFAAKEAVRERVRSRLSVEVHPADITLVRVRDDLFVVSEVPALTAQDFVDHLGPTRFSLRTRLERGAVTAWFEAADPRAVPPFPGL